MFVFDYREGHFNRNYNMLCSWMFLKAALAITCMLQDEQMNSNNSDSDNDQLALALRFLRFKHVGYKCYAAVSMLSF